MKKPLCLETHIKVKLPGNFMIEVNFGVKENIGALIKTLDELLITPDYFLFIPPFIKNKITKQNMLDSFADFELVPDGTLNLLFLNEELNKQGAQILK